MKKNKNIVLLLVILIFGSLSTLAQTENKNNDETSNIVPNYTELRIIHSQIIDDDYYLYIKLPKSYKDSDKSYPVIYLLDGDIAFTMAWSTVRYLQYGEYLPEAIIVGIGYGSLLSSQETMRERDYTISKFRNRDDSGGAKKFLSFLKTELIPYVDSNYRAMPDERTINGYSLGGLFVMYVFLNENELFTGFIAGSPYLSSDIESLHKSMMESSEVLKNSNAKLFISYGSLENEELYVNPINNIVEDLNEIQLEKRNIHLRIFEGGSHFTCPSEAMVYGLKYVFE